MVLNTQLQLKWPNHYTHLLTGLKALFENEQLVDCTLNCNKHTLKVHRSVLAACSPYFERELLENNPFIVVKDVQFNVLQALIEFMYYGETRISEDNLTSLIEAAKLFEVKGLSEMDLLASNENSIVLSVVAMNGNVVKSSSDRMESLVYTQPVQLDASYKNTQQSLVSPEDSEDSNSNFVDPSQPHSSRDFVVTPTESAQILLSLARSYSERQQLQPQITTIQADTSCDVIPTTDDFNGDQDFVVGTSLTNGSASHHVTDVQIMHGHHQLPDREHLPVVSEATNVGETELYIKYNGNSVNGDNASDTQNNKSLLATLLTREPTTTTTTSTTTAAAAVVATTQSQSKNLQYYDNNYKLYECESSSSHQSSASSSTATTKNQNEAAAHTSSVAANSFALPPESILECPFLVQTPDGLVDAVEMLNVFDSGEVFDPSTGCKTAIKFVCKEDVVMPTLDCETNPPLSIISDNACPTDTKADPLSIGERELLLIQQDTEDELRDDPDAVVLCKVNENGEVEKYIFSSADMHALKAMNEQLKLERQQLHQQQQQQQVTFDAVDSSYVGEVELRTSENKSLITRIFSAGQKVENAISKLPFKRPLSTATGGRKGLEAQGGGGSDVDEDVANVNTMSSSSSSSERLIDPAAVLHHEDMFEELDNHQFLDCSMSENMQQDYVAYEEASKNETQLEHNYYANAMKDEDEECAVVISGGSFDLPSVMLIQQSTDDVDLNLVALSNNNNKGKSNANTSSAPASSATSTLANTFQLFSAADDAYLNGGGGGERLPRRNGVIDKPTFNGKCDLILNSDELVNSLLLSTVMHDHVSTTANTTKNTKTRATNCALDAAATTSGVRGSRNTKTKRRNSVNDAYIVDGPLTLPFKKVKNATKNGGANATAATAVVGKKLRRTNRRRSTSLNENSKFLNENYHMNGGVHTQNNNINVNNNNNNNNLIEEIIVDEVL